MDSVFDVLALMTGLVALVFKRKVANAMNSFSIGIGELFQQWRWPTALPPWSRERFENWLWWVRLWAAYMVVIGAVLVAGDFCRYCR